MIAKNFLEHTTALWYYENTGVPGYKTYITDITGTEYKQEGWLAATDTRYALPGMMFRDNLKTLDVPAQTSKDIGGGMFLGSGHTPAKKDDYSLEKPIGFAEDGLTKIGESVSVRPNADDIAIYTLTVKNNSKTPITVSEAGLIVQTGAVDKLKCLKFLVAREVFEEKIIQPGRTMAFTLTIEA